MTTQRIKVNVAELIKAIETKRAAVIADHAQRSARGKAQASTIKRAVVDGLRDALSAARKGDYPSAEQAYRGGRYKMVVGIQIELDVDWNDYEAAASKKKKPDTTSMDRDLAALKLAAEPTITIATDSNFFRYLA